MALTASESWLAGLFQSPFRQSVESAVASPDLVDAVSRHGLAALARHQGLLSLSTADDLEVSASEALKWSMLLEGETRRICALASSNGIQLLLLKGTALAHWLYEEPHLRASSDVDVLVHDEPQARRLAELLVKLGYRWVSASDPLVGYEMLCVHDLAPGVCIEIDVHWSVGCTPVFNQALPFAELWARSIAIPRLGTDARGLSAADALAHACIARISDLANDAGESLKTLYDISLLSGLLSPECQKALVQRAKAKHLSGTIVLGLEAADKAFGLAPATHDLISMLKENAPTEPFEASRLASWRYMQVRSLLSIPGVLPKLRWIKHRVFPNREQLGLYPDNRGSYLRRVINRLTTEKQRKQHR